MIVIRARGWLHLDLLCVFVCVCVCASASHSTDESPYRDLHFSFHNFFSLLMIGVLC
jgi:hypothetical protein